MKSIFFYLLILCISSSTFAQTSDEDFSQAYPIIGWDSLRNTIEQPENFPDNLRIRCIMESVPVYIMIDSSGTLTNVVSFYDDSNLTNPDSISHREFIIAIEHILRPIKWLPSLKNNKPIKDKIYKTFNFLLLGHNESEFNIVAPKIYIK